MFSRPSNHLKKNVNPEDDLYVTQPHWKKTQIAVNQQTMFRYTGRCIQVQAERKPFLQNFQNMEDNLNEHDLT